MSGGDADEHLEPVLARQKRLGEVMRKARSAADLSQPAVAGRSPLLSQSMVSRIENGEAGWPSIDHLVLFCEALQVSLRDVLEASGYLPSDDEGTRDLEMQILASPELSKDAAEALVGVYRVLRQMSQKSASAA